MTNQDDLEAVYLRTIPRHNLLSTAIMRLAERDVFRKFKYEGLLLKYKKQPYTPADIGHPCMIVITS